MQRSLYFGFRVLGLRVLGFKLSGCRAFGIIATILELDTPNLYVLSRNCKLQVLNLNIWSLLGSRPSREKTTRSLNSWNP